MRTLVCILLLLCATSCTRRYYIVRHANRPVTGEDRLTVPEGETRARDLATLLRPKNITRIYSTKTVRTQQTAQPLSSATGVPITLYKLDTLANFVRMLKKQPNSLVVGHSDSILETVHALGAPTSATSINANEFDRLFIVKRKKPWLRPVETTVTETRYGAVAH